VGRKITKEEEEVPVRQRRVFAILAANDEETGGSGLEGSGLTALLKDIGYSAIARGQDNGHEVLAVCGEVHARALREAFPAFLVKELTPTVYNAYSAVFGEFDPGEDPVKWFNRNKGQVR
jgi:hypothetical protein